jgi:hypothetical protein
MGNVQRPREERDVFVVNIGLMKTVAAGSARRL